jgi:MoxR-like ATPase
VSHDLGAPPIREGANNGGSQGAGTPAEAGRGQFGPAEIMALGGQIAAAVNRVLLGKPEVVRLAVVALLTEGHLLIEDVPGVGKTRLAKALAKTVDATVNRVQFTPDLMPSDVTGVSVYDRNSGAFEFRPGPVFANILVADEINRASPKTQSALLEAMEEQQVTSDGTTYPLEKPFLVMATQNPVEMEGTYPLPEAQRDRFLARTAIGYPDRRAEAAMLNEQDHHDPLDDLTPVVDRATVRRLIEATSRIHVAPELQHYIVDLVSASRGHPDVRLGASPRAALHLVRAAKASAALDGRPFVIPDDIGRMAVPVLSHRILLTVESHAARRSEIEIIGGLLANTRVPRGSNG